jgi:hypothetical protein
MKDTPRTDKFYDGDFMSEHAECEVFARQLERELAQAERTVAGLRYAILEALHVLDIPRADGDKLVDVSVAKTWLRNALAGNAEVPNAPADLPAVAGKVRRDVCGEVSNG